MKIKVSEGGLRIDLFLAREMEYSRSKVSKLVKNGKVFVNEKPVSSSYKVKSGDIVSFEEITDDEIDIVPEKMDIDIVYEDEYLAVVNKKSGIVVHPAVGNYSHTLVNGLMHYFNNISKEGTIRPGIVHRLDKDTSGLMMVAKNDFIHDKLSNMIKEKQVERKYLALVWGNIKHEKGTIDAPIGRDLNNRQKFAVTDINSKDSVTHFKVLERFKDVTLIECKLDTGRTHQIRVHMEYIGHPVVNDPVYGKRKIINDFGQMLHSKSIKFVHPVTLEELFFEVEPPKEFNQILESFK
ncbi:MAG: RluA family pseudouridine synthase [Bacilli bacterium]